MFELILVACLLAFVIKEGWQVRRYYQRLKKDQKAWEKSFEKRYADNLKN